MEWWMWLLVAVGVYLVLCLLPWGACAIVSARLRRRGSFVSTVMPRIGQLVDAERAQSGLWPQAPRPGRYEAIDLKAQELLGSLREALAAINQEADAVAAYTPPVLTPVRLLTLGAWRALRDEWRALSARRELDEHLEAAERMVAALAEQQAQAAAVPERLEADLSEARAEARRLYALWEGELEQGTREIQSVGDGLALVDNAIGAITEMVRVAAAGQEAETIVRADQQLAMAWETIHRTESELESIRQHREQAHQALTEARGTLAAAEARWGALQARGAQDPSVAERVADLQRRVQALEAILEQATPSAFVEALEAATSVAALGTSVTGELDAFESLIEQSGQALAASQRLLDDAQGRMAELQQSLPLLVLDESAAAIADARSTLEEAANLLAAGTWHGYQTGTSLAQQAQAALQAVMARLAATAEAVQKLDAQRQQVGREARLKLREQAEALAGRWSLYGRHWHPMRQQALADALQNLDAADAAWDALPEAYRSTGACAESELGDLETQVGRVAELYAQARQGIAALVDELAHIESLRTQLESGLAKLDAEIAPELARMREAMLPELAERYDAWLADYQAQRATLSDPSQIDYDRATLQWLPTVTEEAQQIRSAYEGDVAHYSAELKDAERRLSRAWARLQRLDPLKAPLPAEDITQLTQDYERWVSAVEENADSPAALSVLVTREATELERRMEAARQQIEEGRQSLASLNRQFSQLQQSLQRTRASLRSLEQDSQWSQIRWVLGTGQEAWERALAAQEAAAQSESLDLAVSEMGRAVSLGQEALQTYSGAEQQLKAALDRLNREFRAATAELDRAQRRAGQLRQQGPSEELSALDERIAEAMSLVSMAQNAVTYDDALRHLRESQEVLARD